MRIGIDIDDTICYSIENMLPYICMWYGLDYEIEKSKRLPYDYYHKFPNYYDFAIKHYEKVMPFAKLKENADFYINRLYDLGHDIIFITARSDFGFNEPYKISSQYLNKNNFCYDKLIVGAKDKGRVCKEEKIDLFIDDNLKNCDNVLKENIEVWLFDNYFNRDDNRFDRVYNWKDVYNRIINK